MESQALILDKILRLEKFEFVSKLSSSTSQLKKQQERLLDGFLQQFLNSDETNLGYSQGTFSAQHARVLTKLFLSETGNHLSEFQLNLIL